MVLISANHLSQNSPPSVHTIRLHFPIPLKLDVTMGLALPHEVSGVTLVSDRWQLQKAICNSTICLLARVIVETQLK